MQWFVQFYTFCWCSLSQAIVIVIFTKWAWQYLLIQTKTTANQGVFATGAPCWQVSKSRILASTLILSQCVSSQLNSTMRATLRFYTFLYFSQFTSPEELLLEQQQMCLRPPELFPLRDKTTVWLCQQFQMSLSPLSMILWKVNIEKIEWHEISLNNWWIH